VSNEFISYDSRTVDLGLPSGLLWCEYNLDAFPSINPDDWYGKYYAWGETEVKDEYTWETYSYYRTRDSYEYNSSKNLGLIDYKNMLDPADDVIAKTLKKRYRMPNIQDFQELLDNTTYKWVKNYDGIDGLNGELFISAINGNTLFFPAAGLYDENGLCGSGDGSYIWLSSIYSDYQRLAYAMGFVSRGGGFNGYTRYCGLPVRGVKYKI